MAEYPRRKLLRLQGYDYSKNGAYFVTICTQNREPIFGTVGADPVSARLTTNSLSAKLISEIFEKVICSYRDVYCPNYVVMPNHFHAIIVIDKDYGKYFINTPDPERADTGSAPTISEVMQSFKRYSTTEYTKLVRQGVLPPFDKKIWQRSFHDHIIRNEKDFQAIYKYIDENPVNWENDCFYCEQ